MSAPHEIRTGKGDVRPALGFTQQSAVPVIPPRPNRRRPHAYDKHLYKERNGVERCFGKLKQFRRLATRYDKLLTSVTGFATLAAILLWVR